MRGVVGWVGLLVGVAGCADAPGVHRGAEVVDSAGVRIVASGALAPAPTLVPPDPVPVLEIGTVGGEEADQLYQVSDAARMPDGTVVVANGGSREVKIYGPDGVHRATVGGAGRGPSEFRYPRAVIPRPPDTVVVQDFMDRVTFTTAGEFVGRRTHRPDDMAALFPGGFSEGGSWLPDGSLVAPVYERMSGRPTVGPPYRPRVTLVRIPEDLTAADTLGEFGGIRQQFVDIGGARAPVWSVVAPFAASTSWGMKATDGSVLVADNAEPQVRMYHPDGRVIFARWTAEAAPVRAGEVEAVLDEWRVGWAADRLEENERGWAQMDVPETKPFYERAFQGRDGSAWVFATRSPGDATTVYHVFGPDGAYRGRADFPGRFAVQDAGPDWVLGTFRDDDDVEFIRVYRLDG